MKAELTIYPVETKPDVDRTLVVGWRDAWPLPAVYEYRKKKDWFYRGAIAGEIDRWFYLADLADPAAVDRIRERWNERDELRPGTGIPKERKL